MPRDCIVYTSTLKDEIRYRGKFHGFFQVENRDETYADSYPVALVEKADGKVREVMIQFFGFENNDAIAIVLESLPKYKTHSKGLKIPCLN